MPRTWRCRGTWCRSRQGYSAVSCMVHVTSCMQRREFMHDVSHHACHAHQQRAHTDRLLLDMSIWLAQALLGSPPPHAHAPMRGPDQVSLEEVSYVVGVMVMPPCVALIRYREPGSNHSEGEGGIACPYCIRPPYFHQAGPFDLGSTQYAAAPIICMLPHLIWAATCAVTWSNTTTMPPVSIAHMPTIDTNPDRTIHTPFFSFSFILPLVLLFFGFDSLHA